jgi:hypothetical protein
VFKIRPATRDDVADIALNLRSDDYREVVEGAGLNPVLSISLSISSGSAIVFDTPDGKAAGVDGVDASGCIWMLCTDKIEQYPIAFVRQARSWIDSLPHKLLYNKADIRNTVHLKLLKHLGFKFLRVVHYGPNNLYFVEFVRLWHSH